MQSKRLKYFKIEILRTHDGSGFEVYVNGNREVPTKEKMVLALYQAEAEDKLI